MYSTSRTQTTTCLLGPQFSSRCLNMQDLCLSFPVYLACLNICFCATVGLSEYPVVFLSMSPGTTLHMCLPSVHQTLLHTIRSPRSFSSPHLHTSSDQRLEVGMAWDKAHSVNWVVCLDFDDAGFIPRHQLVLTLSVLFIPFRQLSCVS